MLLVKTYINASPIHGFGLFAAESIPEGTPIWRFTPGFDLDVEPALLDTLPTTQQAVLLHYGYIDVRLGRYILCCDNARFINHSVAPNITTEHGNDPHGLDVAMRDIVAGEELTIDYGLLEGHLDASTLPA